MNTHCLRVSLLAGCVLASSWAAAQTMEVLPQHAPVVVAPARAHSFSTPAMPVSRLPVVKPTVVTMAKPNPLIIQPFKCGPGKVTAIMNGKTSCVPNPHQARQR